MIDKLYKRLYTTLAKPVIRHYLRKARVYKTGGMELVIDPGVFHPGYFFSSHVFERFLDRLQFEGKNVCDMGSGSGILGIKAHRLGSAVTCIDISKAAISCIRANYRKNALRKDGFVIIESDVFGAVPQQTFDYIFVNPPYFFDDPVNEQAYAWYCGRNGEYFNKLFSRLSLYTGPSSQVYMVLADNCELTRISEIARAYNYSLNKVHEEKVKWEKNYIFSITISNG